VVPLGSGAPYENPAVLRSAFLERFPKARGRRQLLFLGRLHFKKGLDRILTALPSIVRIFPELLLTIAGNGATEFERTLKRAISSLGLENSVMMTGRLDGSVKWGAYASAEIFLLPSRQENFAIAVAEAMQMAVPVIVSNKVNTWPYVESAGAGIVIHEERIESDLEDAIVLLLRNCESSRLMGKRGQEYARKNLTWAVAATKLLKCYEEVLACREFHNQN
jgi:glycosyltransferase involved in cell wall biosynthesis